MSLSERNAVLRELQNRLDEQKKVYMAIRQACDERRRTGKPVNHVYFTRLRDRERALPFEIQMLQAKMRTFGRPIKDAVRHAFMEVAAERLPREVFDEIREEARRRAGEAA